MEEFLNSPLRSGFSGLSTGDERATWGNLSDHRGHFLGIEEDNNRVHEKLEEHTQRATFTQQAAKRFIWFLQQVFTVSRFPASSTYDEHQKL
jgi:hypothetical protein